MANKHLYTLELNWKGNPTGNSIQNDRLYEVKIEGKETFLGSADKTFFGDPTLYNPEDLLLSALTSCHMMSYFYLCRKHQISILNYTDTPIGTLVVHPNGSGQFQKVVLQPTVMLANSDLKELALSLHTEAKKLCFIANSCAFEIVVEAKITY